MKPINQKKIKVDLKTPPSYIECGQISSLQIVVKNLTLYMKTLSVGWEHNSNDLKLVFVEKSMQKASLKPNQEVTLTYKIISFEGGLINLPKIKVYEKDYSLKCASDKNAKEGTINTYIDNHKDSARDIERQKLAVKVAKPPYDSMREVKEDEMIYGNIKDIQIFVKSFESVSCKVMEKNANTIMPNVDKYKIVLN